MLFLDFLRLYFCTVLLINAHPISKSNSYEHEFDEKLENSNIIPTPPVDIITNILNEEKNINFNNKALKNEHENTIIANDTFKRQISTSERDLKGLDNFDMYSKGNKLHNSIKTYKWKDEGNNIFKENDMKQNSNLNQKTVPSIAETVSKFLDNKRVFYNDLSMDPSEDDNEFAVTAEIETILNEIKQRESHIIAENLPSLSNLINNAVTEITFSSMPLISETNIYPHLEFLSSDNTSLNQFRPRREGKDFHNSKLYNMVRRSIKQDSSTLANDVENLLQKKIKKVYHKIKTKFSKDLKNEIKKTKATVKKEVTKITKIVWNTTQFPNIKTSKTKHPKTQRNDIRKSRKTLLYQGQYQDEPIALTSHLVPPLGDDVSMLSILEQILEKSQDDTNLILTTLKYKENNSKEKHNHRDLQYDTFKRNIRDLFNNDEEDFYPQYFKVNHSISNNTDLSRSSKNSNMEEDASTEDTSYSGLSNKISYNDYVNGYKYYLNFQRDNDDQKYSNHIRYQAHRHHNVDDIGKFILNKIPNLATTRQRRHLVDYETIEDQDVSTKSEDSWFKKHFFLFIDSNPPKKFHTSQTVLLKPSGIQNINNCTTDLTTKKSYENTELSQIVERHKRKHNSSLAKQSLKERNQTRISGKMFKRSNVDNHYKQKSGTSFNFDHKNNGFVDINLIHKPTAIIKLNNKNKKGNKFRNMFRKIRFGHSKVKKKEKRQSINRFNIFKGIKNMIKEINNPKGKGNSKIFDYEVLTPSIKSEHSYEVGKLNEIENIRAQIPNIKAVVIPSTTITNENLINPNYLTSVYLGQKDGKFIPHNKKPELNDKRKSFSILTESQSLKDDQRYVPSQFLSNKQKLSKESAIARKETKLYNFFHSPDSYPSTVNSKIKSEIEDIKSRLLKFDKNKEIQKITSVGNENKKNIFFNEHPQSDFFKECQLKLPPLHDMLQSDNVDIKTTSTIAYENDRVIFSKDYTENEDSLFFYNTSSPAPIFTMSTMFEQLLFNMNDYSEKFATTKLEVQENEFNEPRTFVNDKSFNHLQEDKDFGIKINKFRPTPKDLTTFTYDKTLNDLQDDLIMKNFGLTTKDITRFAYDKSIHDLEEEKYFGLKTNKFSPATRDLTIFAYDKNLNFLKDKNFVQKKDKYRVTPTDFNKFTYDKSLNKFQEDTSFVQKNNELGPNPKIFKFDKSFGNLQEDKHFVEKKKKFRPITANLTKFKNGNHSKEISGVDPVARFNDYTDANIIRPVTKVNTPPEQYYSTPLPMRNEDFYKFLRNQSIDVESVTSPLSDPLPKRIDAWDIYKKNLTKILSKQQKILGNDERYEKTEKKDMTKNFLKHGRIHSNQEKLFNITKTVKSKPSLSYQKVLDKEKQKKDKIFHKRLDSKCYNKLIGNKYRFLNFGKYSMIQRSHTSESMGSFDLNDLSNQPITKSPKIFENLDATIIDGNKNTNLDRKNLLLNMNDISKKHQKLAKVSKTLNRNAPYLRTENPYTKNLKFTSMQNEYMTPKTTNAQLYGPVNRKTKVSRTLPRRVQISGHSYKYDIIYQQPKNNWMQDLDTYDVYPTYNLSINTNSGRYMGYPLKTTTLKYGNRNRRRYYRRDNFEENIYNFSNNSIDNITWEVSKTDDTFWDPLSSMYPPTKCENNLKTNVSKTIKMPKKSFYFGIKEPTNIDDVIYYEPLLKRKPHRKMYGKSTYKNKFHKRDVQLQDSFTVKDVAAFEVVVDLVKSTEAFYDKGLPNALLDTENQNTPAPFVLCGPKTGNNATNSIQVHIALPSNLNDRKRSLEPIKIRKVFSAIMSTPVDLEYQIHTFEDNKVTKMPQDVISPGLYLLVENTNLTSPNSNFSLKPIKSRIGISKLISSDNNMNITYENDNTFINSKVKKSTIRPDIAATVKSQLVKLNENIPVLNEKKFKRNIQNEIIFYNQNAKKLRRGSSWEKFKKYFDHDRVCNCHCKINTTMCKPCAASDAVISELIFEFDNLAKYMTDHCTEIQTFFWMNPTGGRKLKDTVHRLDATLNNYYKRLKDKCKGRTCQMISSNIDKREYNSKEPINKYLYDLKLLVKNLENVAQNSIFDINIFKSGKKCVRSINTCINTEIKKNFNKRSYKSGSDDLGEKSFYSLNNIKVNLICNKDFTKNENNGLAKNVIKAVSFEGNTKTPLYLDEDERKRENKKGISLRDLIKKYSYKLNLRKNKRDQALVGKRNNFTKIQNKRYTVNENRFLTPLIRDNRGTCWNKKLQYNLRLPRHYKKSLKHLKRNATVMSVTEIIKTTNTVNLNEINNKQDKSDEKDGFLKIDSLNHNLNDLFKLLGNIETVEHNKGDKILENLSKLQRNFSSSTSKTTTKTGTTQKLKDNSSTHYSKDDLETDKSNNQLSTKNKISKTTKNVLTKTLNTKTQHTTITLTPEVKGGFLNRIVGVSLKFLGKKENTKKNYKNHSNVENRAVSEIFNKYRKKFVVNTEKGSGNYNKETNKNITSMDSTIIIIDDADFSGQCTIPIKRNSNSAPQDVLDDIDRKSLKLSKKKKILDSYENKRNAIGINLSDKIKAYAKNITKNKEKNCDYDIIHSIKSALSLTSNNLTNPKVDKEVSNKIFDKISMKFTPENDGSVLHKKSNIEDKISSTFVTMQLNLQRTQNLSTYDNSSENNTGSTVANTIENQSENRVTKMTVTRSTGNDLSLFNNISKHLTEAGEDGIYQICDISATMAFVTKLQKSLSKEHFDQYVKNIPCHKYKRAPNYFIIRSCIRRPSKISRKRQRKLRIFRNINGNRFRKWDWIRNKRSLINYETRVEDDIGGGCKEKPLLSFSNYLSGRKKQEKKSDLNGNFIQLLNGENDYYENFIRGKDGIYGKSLKRRKRLDADMSELNEGLQNLPSFRPSTDEIYAMVAESISLDCYLSDSPKNQYKSYIWTTDRVGILDLKNIIVDGPKVHIKNVQTNNAGNYLCDSNNVIIRNIKLTVIDLPAIDIVFTPLYEIKSCSYDNLNNLQKLGEHMSHFTCKKECSARIDEPICLKDNVDGSRLIRPIVVMSVKRQVKIVNCSAICLRDLHCSKAFLVAKNAPVLALVKVLIISNDTNIILSPLTERKRSYVTHTLREKDANGHREYHRLAADLDPNSVNVVLLCSAGFYLVVGQKICAVCPPNTYSLEGENVCRNCPRGASSEPGSRSCRLTLHLRKYNCPWKYECAAAVCVLSCVIACCYAVLRLLRQPVSAKEIKTGRKTREGLQIGSDDRKKKRRPLSPSRVILSRLLQGSLSSSRATDSQETRFELWKEKNTLPPLPPIDFEL